ncbi:cytokine receptor common subunit gamma-like [Solea senegalensis]|uniref:Cytokine receptor common subunit gamma-like n=1 Tax=Solea senegalensis TaxID=28829 RepID=A0AAV6SDM8_SOLSE|nr:cytokine receptor common subunit gamma-like [Solea senegalensis]KAG7515538.1 cytokine receptor common subunit gamma-like [Solea senegalensis]
MPTRLLLFLCLIGHVFAKEPPDVDCLVVHFKYVACSWNKQGPPEVNYTFSSGFNEKELKNCTTYVSQNNTITGCNQTYERLKYNKFMNFFTRLAHGNKTFQMHHLLKDKVLLFPPTNLTVQNGSDFNLWFYWNQTSPDCVDSEVRYRTNNNKWAVSAVSTGRQKYCINLPSSSSRYELQVRSRIAAICGESSFWSDWSEPAVWGSNNSTVTNHINPPLPVWMPLLYTVGAFIFILAVVLMLHHERVRFISISVVPKPSLALYDIEDWLQFSKGLKGNFKTNYNEHACPVREYCHVSQSDNESSDSSDSSTFSNTTDQTDCSVSAPLTNSEDGSSSCSSSSSVFVPTQEEQQQDSV